MLKKLSDVTFEEFSAWANARACDGRWGFADAMTSAAILSEVYAVKPLFRRKKKQEEKFREIRGMYLNLEASIDIPE